MFHDALLAFEGIEKIELVLENSLQKDVLGWVHGRFGKKFEDDGEDS